MTPHWTLARRAHKMNPSVIREILKFTERPGINRFAGGLYSVRTFPKIDFVGNQAQYETQGYPEPINLRCCFTCRTGGRKPRRCKDLRQSGPGHSWT